ncbi:GntR family transcriptional regulator [Kitasatospora fiedleri]|uniref:GntR family transcriptional regulator n=1 Tax=Kitasatospora fiedleri TaxID=2991545 RepID=UPI00249B1D81|nr:winged helix-turn-helix domain-containing protein [Kitasatospora fiedleri]
MDEPSPGTVDPDRPVYVYVQVADDLAAQIAAGRLAAGSMLPSERDLAALYGVAYLTIRRAIRELRERGLVTTLPAKGTYVTSQPPERPTP